MNKQYKYRYKDLTGQKFHKLLFVAYADLGVPKASGRWLCRCDCGNEKIMIGSNVIKSGRHTTSCGCMAYTTVIRYKDRTIPAMNNAFFKIREGAKRRNLSFELSFEYWYELTQAPCHYCGESLCSSSRKNDSVFKNNGVDRLDNTVGYIPENCVPCCSVCNLAKRTLTEEEFLTKIKKIYEHRRLDKCL